MSEGAGRVTSVKKLVHDAIWGDPALRDEVNRGEVKAGVIDTRRNAIDALYGVGAFEKAIPHMPAEVARVAKNPPYYMAWMSFETLGAIDSALITHVLGGDTAKMRAVVAEGARLELNVLYKFLLKLGSPGFVLKRLGVVFSSKARPGLLKEEHIGANDATMTMTQMVLPYYYYAHVLPAWAETALALSGAKRPEVLMQACPHWGDTMAKYHVAWR